MTDAMKQKLFQWLLGKYVKTEPVLSPSVEWRDSAGSYLKYIQDNFNNYKIIDIISTNYTNNQLNISVVYGTYDTNKGFIVLANQNGELIQAMTKFSSGTSFSAWIYMGIGEDGQFFATDTNKRLLLLNNFAIKSATQSQYEVKIRKSYAFPNTTQAYNNNIVGIKKSPVEGVYLIYGNTTAAASSPFVTKFKIDINLGNEWSEYTYTNTDRTSDVKDLYVSDWENLYFQIGSVDFDDTYKYTEYSISSDTTTMTRTDKLSPIVSATQITIGQLFITSERYACIGLNIMALEQYMGVGIIDRQNNTISILNVGTYTEVPVIRILDNEIFIFSANTFQQYPDVGYETKVGMVINNQYVNLRSRESTNIANEFNDSFMVNKVYNLYTLTFCISNANIGTVFMYNPNNYNGQFYYDYNSFVPNSMVLSNKYSEVPTRYYREFARNLYNVRIDGATTTSTIEVPNLNMNDIEINKCELLSETNTTILSDTNQEFTKNIYETLYFNFIHTLSISNENDPDNVILNNEASERLNESISSVCDYENSKCTKYRINYDDESSTIFNFNDIIIAGSGMIGRYSMTVYNATWRHIVSIDFLSNDEQTIYLTIEPTLEEDKFYTIQETVVIR